MSFDRKYNKNKNQTTGNNNSFAKFPRIFGNEKDTEFVTVNEPFGSRDREQGSINANSRSYYGFPNSQIFGGRQSAQGLQSSHQHTDYSAKDDNHQSSYSKNTKSSHRGGTQDNRIQKSFQNGYLGYQIGGYGPLIQHELQKKHSANSEMSSERLQQGNSQNVLSQGKEDKLSHKTTPHDLFIERSNTTTGSLEDIKIGNIAPRFNNWQDAVEHSQNDQQKSFSSHQTEGELASHLQNSFKGSSDTPAVQPIDFNPYDYDKKQSNIAEKTSSNVKNNQKNSDLDKVNLYPWQSTNRREETNINSSSPSQIHSNDAYTEFDPNLHKQKSAEGNPNQSHRVFKENLALKNNSSNLANSYNTVSNLYMHQKEADKSSNNVAQYNWKESGSNNKSKQTSNSIRPANQRLWQRQTPITGSKPLFDEQHLGSKESNFTQEKDFSADFARLDADTKMIDRETEQSTLYQPVNTDKQATLEMSDPVWNSFTHSTNHSQDEQYRTYEDRSIPYGSGMDFEPVNNEIVSDEIIDSPKHDFTDDDYDNSLYNWAAPSSAETAYNGRRSGKKNVKHKKKWFVFLILILLMVISAAGYFLYNKYYNSSVDGPIFINKADKNYKVKPERSQKTKVDNQEKSVTDGLNGDNQNAQHQPLIDKTEQPMDMHYPGGKSPFSADQTFDKSSIDPLVNMAVARASPVHYVSTAHIDANRKITYSEAHKVNKDDNSETKNSSSTTEQSPQSNQTSNSAQPNEMAKGDYFVQISSQPSREAAIRSISNAKQNLNSEIASKLRVVSAEIPGKGTYYRVRIPNLTSEDASDLCNSYKQSGKSCFVGK